MFSFIKKIFNKFTGNEKSSPIKLDTYVPYKLQDTPYLDKDKIVYGCIKDPEDLRDIIKSVPRASIVEADKSSDFSLKEFLHEVRNQGNTGSCTGFATAYALYILASRLLYGDSVFSENVVTPSGDKVLPPFSPLWNYYNARCFDNWQDKDDGATIRSAMRSLADCGGIQEGRFPFNKYTPLSKPPRFGDEVVKYKIRLYNRVLIYADNNYMVQTLKAILSEEKLPVVAGIRLYKDSYNKDGIFNPLSDSQRSDGNYLGGHAICITGYKMIDDQLYFEFVNSWGKSWGTEGFGYINSSMINDMNYITDLWTFDKEYF